MQPHGINVLLWKWPLYYQQLQMWPATAPKEFAWSITFVWNVLFLWKHCVLCKMFTTSSIFTEVHCRDSLEMRQNLCLKIKCSLWSTQQGESQGFQNLPTTHMFLLLAWNILLYAFFLEVQWLRFYDSDQKVKSLNSTTA